MGGVRGPAPPTPLRSATLDLIFCLRFCDCLPLHVRWNVSAAFREWNDVIDHVSRTTVRIACRLHELALCCFAPLNASVRVACAAFALRRWRFPVRDMVLRDVTLRGGVYMRF